MLFRSDSAHGMGLPVGGTTSLRRRAWRRSPGPSVIEQEDSDRGLVVKFGLATVVWLSSAARDGEHVEYRHRRTVCGRHRHACVVKLDVDEARRGAALILPEEKGDAASVTGARADREVPVGDIDRQGRSEEQTSDL